MRLLVLYGQKFVLRQLITYVIVDIGFLCVIKYSYIQLVCVYCVLREYLSVTNNLGEIWHNLRNRQAGSYRVLPIACKMSAPPRIHNDCSPSALPRNRGLNHTTKKLVCKCSSNVANAAIASCLVQMWQMPQLHQICTCANSVQT